MIKLRPGHSRPRNLTSHVTFRDRPIAPAGSSAHTARPLMSFFLVNRTPATCPFPGRLPAILHAIPASSSGSCLHSGHWLLHRPSAAQLGLDGLARSRDLQLVGASGVCQGLQNLALASAGSVRCHIIITVERGYVSERQNSPADTIQFIRGLRNNQKVKNLLTAVSVKTRTEQEYLRCCSIKGGSSP